MNFTLKIKTLFISYIINLFNGDNYHNVSKIDYFKSDKFKKEVNLKQ